LRRFETLTFISESAATRLAERILDGSLGEVAVITPPTVAPELLERQVRHAVERPVTVRLGGVHEFGNADHTFYVEVLDPSDLDAARVASPLAQCANTLPYPGDSDVRRRWRLCASA
jgi:hypothetical protein